MHYVLKPKYISYFQICGFLIIQLFTNIETIIEALKLTGEINESSNV